MKKKLIIIIDHFFTKFHKKNLNIIFFKKKFNTKILYYNRLFKYEKKNYTDIQIQSVSMLIKYLLFQKDKFYLIDALTLNLDSVLIRKEIKNILNVNNIVIKELNGYPKIIKNNLLQTIKNRYETFFSPKSFYFKILNIFLYYFFIRFQKKDILVVPGKKKYTNGFKNYIYTRSKEYSIINFKKKKIKKKYAVFLDTNFINHPEFQNPAIHINFHRKMAPRIYNQLNNFFIDLYQLINIKIIILSHPSNSIANLRHFFKKFKIVKNKTQMYLSRSSLVLNINSTAYAEAVILKKPIVHLTSHNIEKMNNSLNLTKQISHELGNNIINLDNWDKKINIKDIFYFNKSKYSEFINNYLKHPKAKNNCNWYESFYNFTKKE
jgi:hypothetical protein